MLPKEESRRLMCQLTDEERLIRGRELADLNQDIDTETLEQESAKKQMKAKLAEMEGKRSRLASVVSRGEELRDVQVNIKLKGDVIIETRLDTGEIIATRPPYESERQMDLK